MEITTSTRDSDIWLHLRGDLNREAVPRLKDAVAPLVGETLPPLYLDLAEVPYLDSSGLGTLLYIHKTWKSHGQRMVLANLSPLVKKFLSTTGLLRHFQHIVSGHGTSGDSLSQPQLEGQA